MIAVNVTIELMGSAISIILILSLLVNGDLKSRVGVLFGWMLGLQLLVLSSDAVSWALTNQTGVWVHRVVVATNFIAFSMGIAAQVVFAAYIFACIDQRQPVSHAPMRVIVIMCCIIEGFIIASEFNGFIYRIDAANVFHIGPGYWALLVHLFLIFTYIATIAWSHRHILGKKDAALFVIYAVVMIVANVVETFIPELMINYMVSTLMTLMIYVNIQAKKRAELELEMMEARVAVMLSQIQPHFLYNALVAIERLCVRDPRQAQVSIANFSTYLRGNLDSLSMRSPIAFVDELKHVQVYLALEDARFGDRLQVVYDIQAEAFMLPALTLQTIVENAVQHGVTQRTEGGTVIIRTRSLDTQWCITIEDDGVGFDVGTPDTQKRTHIGLQNVRNRLAAMCGGRLDIESQPGKGTMVQLFIPKEGVAYGNNRR